MSELYNHKVVDKKWQKVWDDNKAFALNPSCVCEICVIFFVFSYTLINKKYYTIQDRGLQI